MAEKRPLRSEAAGRAAVVTPYVGSRLWLLLAGAWLVPGVGHLLLGRRQKGLTFLFVLPLMFLFGLWLDGRLFPFRPQEAGDVLVTLMAIADAGIGLPNIVARLLGFGAGRVTAITYEYGNTFILVAGLLNMLVVLDAYDVAEGRK